MAPKCDPVKRIPLNSKFKRMSECQRADMTGKINKMPGGVEKKKRKTREAGIVESEKPRARSDIRFHLSSFNAH